MFLAITLTIVPSKMETLYRLPYTSLSTLITCEKIYQAFVVTIKFMLILKLSPVAVLVNVSVSIMFMHTAHRGLLHLNDTPSIMDKVQLLQGNCLVSRHF